jgi:ABC-type Fe3+/spermidine/putrescine transport system ATPase subunit
MPEVVLEVQRLVKRYGAATAVDRVSFELYRGETLTLLGPSGCGKSTTLRLIAGLERPDDGDILVHGVVIASGAKRICLPPEKRNMGLVFQSYAIWPHMTVEENVAYPLKIRHVPDKEVRRRVGRMLELTGLEGFAQRPSTQLSGGQQQRVALARALIYEPDILLLDEPLSNLDAKLRHEMRVQLKRLQAALGTTILFVTHDQLEAMTLSHRIAVMRAGVIEQLGGPREIYNHPTTHFVHSFIGQCINLRGRVAGTGAERYVEVAGQGRVTLPPDQLPAAVGEGVWLSIRPEHVEIVANGGEPAPNQLAAVVDDVAYVGDRYECALRLGEAEIVLEAPRTLDLRAGQPVRLALDAAAIKVWPGAADLN